MGDLIAETSDDDRFIGPAAWRPGQGTLAMGRVDPVLPAPFQDGMDGDQPALIEDADLVGKLMDLDDPAGSVWDAVVIAADRDQAVMADAALELEQRIEGEGRQPLQFGLLGGKGFRDDPLGGAVQAHIGDSGQPVIELDVEVVQVAEAAAEEEVLADVAERPLHFPLRLGPVGPAGRGRKP